MHHIRWLAKLVGTNPARAQTFINRAISMNFKQNIVDFLKRFPPDEIFETRSDFVIRCEELKLLIEEERKAPQDIVRNPQD
jgi:hypothetical protein